MQLLYHFGLGLIVSFLGLLPVGMINLMVVQSTISHNLKEGLKVALGATLVHVVQAFIAFQFIAFFSQYPKLEYGIQVAVIPILLLLGIFFFTKKNTPTTSKKTKKHQQFPNFIKGLVISGLNVAAIPFWMFYATYFATMGWVSIVYPYLLFLMGGVAVGTFGVLLVYAKLGEVLVGRLKNVNTMANKAIGTILILMGLVYAAKVFVF